MFDQPARPHRCHLGAGGRSDLFSARLRTGPGAASVTGDPVCLSPLAGNVLTSDTGKAPFILWAGPKLNAHGVPLHAEMSPKACGGPAPEAVQQVVLELRAGWAAPTDPCSQGSS